MPSISKLKIKAKDGEVVNVYVRSIYLALKKKGTDERVIVYSGIGEHKYGLNVNFALASI